MVPVAILDAMCFIYIFPTFSDLACLIHRQNIILLIHYAASIPKCRKARYFLAVLSI